MESRPVVGGVFEEGDITVFRQYKKLVKVAAASRYIVDERVTTDLQTPTNSSTKAIKR